MTDRRALVISVATGFVLAVFAGAGLSVDRFGELRLAGGVLAAFFATWIAGTALLYLYLINSTKISAFFSRRKSDRLPFIAIWGIIFGCWIPVLLAEFPGFFVYDATDEYVSVATRTFTTHHPLLHTLVLGGFTYGGEVAFGSANTGIFIYLLIQALVLSLIFAWIVNRQEKFRLLSTLFYALFPTVVMFALCSVKDTVFAAALTCAVILTMDILKAGERNVYAAGEPLISRDETEQSSETCSNRLQFILLGLALTIMMLMRNNGVYACVVYAIVMLVVTEKAQSDAGIALPDGTGKEAGDTISKKTPGGIRQNICVRTAIMLACAFAAYFLISGGLKIVTHADSGTKEHQEILTVPIQQLARTYRAYGDSWSSSECEKLYEYLPEEGLGHYTPCLSDPVKIYFDNEAYESDSAGFWNIWKEQLLRHPAAYINAWLNTCYGYFYPLTVVNVYAGHTVYTFTYTESSYFGYETEYPGVRHSLIPAIDGFYRWLSLDDDIQRIPVISLFFSMGALLWLYTCGMALFIYRGDYKAIAAFILPAAVMATLFLGPTFLPRYTVFLWFMLPVFVRRVMSGAN